MHVYLLIYGIDFNCSKALLKYVSLVTQSLLKRFSTPFNMDSQRKHLRHVIIHCFRKDNSAKDTATIMSRSGTTTITILRNWFKRFRAGNFDLKDENRSGCPGTTNMDLTKAMLAENQRYSVREIVDATNIPKIPMIHNHQMRMRYVNQCEVWVPHLLRFASPVTWKRFFLKEACH